MDSADFIIHAGTGGKEGFLAHLEREHEHHYYMSVAYHQCQDIVHDCATYAEARELIGGLLASSIKVIGTHGEEKANTTAAFYMRQVYETVMRSLSAAIVREGGNLS
jgi:hypothetical protein